MNRPLFDRMEQLFTELAAAGEKITQYYAPTPFRLFPKGGISLFLSPKSCSSGSLRSAA